MQRFIFASIATAAIFSAAALAAPASVQVLGNSPDVSRGFAIRMVTVRYDDAEANTKDGAPALLARLSSAAEAVCTARQAGAGTAEREARCKRDALKQAVSMVDLPALTAIAN